MGLMAKASKYRGTDPAVFIVNHSAEEKLCALYLKPWNVHSLLTTGPLVVFQCKRSVRSTRTRATRKRRHGLMQWGIICLHPAVFKRYGPPLALQNMLLASLRLLPLFKSKARFFRDHSIEPLRGCAVFSFRLFLSSSEKKRKTFDLTTAVTACCSRSNIGLARWAYGQPTAPVRTVCDSPLYCLIFDSLQHNSRSTGIHCLFRASFPRSAVVLVFVEQPAKSCFSIAR